MEDSSPLTWALVYLSQLYDTGSPKSQVVAGVMRKMVAKGYGSIEVTPHNLALLEVRISSFIICRTGCRDPDVWARFAENPFGCVYSTRYRLHRRMLGQWGQKHPQLTSFIHTCLYLNPASLLLEWQERASTGDPEAPEMLQAMEEVAVEVAQDRPPMWVCFVAYSNTPLELEGVEMTPHDMYLQMPDGPSVFIHWHNIETESELDEMRRRWAQQWGSKVKFNEMYRVAPETLTDSNIIPVGHRMHFMHPPWVAYTAAPDGSGVPVRHDVTSWDSLCRDFSRYATWNKMRPTLDRPDYSLEINCEVGIYSEGWHDAVSRPDAMCFSADLRWRTVEEAWREKKTSIFTGSVRCDLARNVVEVTEVPLTVVALLGLGAVDECFSDLEWMMRYNWRMLRAEWERYEGSWSRVWLRQRSEDGAWEALTEEQARQLWHLLETQRVGLVAFVHSQDQKWLLK